MQETLLIDVGNSALKFVCYAPQENRFTTLPIRLDWVRMDEIGAELSRDHLANCKSILISSVNRGFCQEVCTRLARVIDVQPQMVDYSMVPMQINVEYPERLGSDRLLAAYAAWSLFGNSKALIVLQVGTAVTIDLVDKHGTYQGGVILPSETTLYSSLAEKTDLLPKIEVDESRFKIDMVAPGELLKVSRDQLIEEQHNVPAKNTVEAIKAGVSHCMRGGVEWTYQRYCRELDATLPVVATGGGALQLRIDQMPMTIVSNLVLKGLSLLCK